ncbi:hypothetical protein OSB04_024320 [Centaurea solstitialis]|uniref:CCHC-type domain-containing protein n=1 Tax=Centaurea solstitialis TaxID=347529 RepID=A0AA38T5D6_9ASTR|nr:hypothetical protein OSB04_024320 [Centaurea solstitialis]
MEESIMIEISTSVESMKAEAKDKFDDKISLRKRRMMRKRQKCFKCGKHGHFAEDCTKPVVRDYSYYKQNTSLVKKKESRKVSLAEQEYWYQSTDSESNKMYQAQVCLMVKKVWSKDDSKEWQINIFFSKNVLDAVSSSNSNDSNEVVQEHVCLMAKKGEKYSEAKDLASNCFDDSEVYSNCYFEFEEELRFLNDKMIICEKNWKMEKKLTSKWEASFEENHVLVVELLDKNAQNEHLLNYLLAEKTTF